MPGISFFAYDAAGRLAKENNKVYQYSGRNKGTKSLLNNTMGKNKLILKIIIVAGVIFSLPLIWIFVFSLGNITVTASSREEFSDAIEKN